MTLTSCSIVIQAVILLQQSETVASHEWNDDGLKHGITMLLHLKGLAQYADPFYMSVLFKPRPTSHHIQIDSPRRHTIGQNVQFA